jgi:hypothetical protein
MGATSKLYPPRLRVGGAPSKSHPHPRGGIGILKSSSWTRRDTMKSPAKRGCGHSSPPTYWSPAAVAIASMNIDANGDLFGTTSLWEPHRGAKEARWRVCEVSAQCPRLNFHGARSVFGTRFGGSLTLTRACKIGARISCRFFREGRENGLRGISTSPTPRIGPGLP